MQPAASFSTEWQSTFILGRRVGTVGSIANAMLNSTSERCEAKFLRKLVANDKFDAQWRQTLQTWPPSYMTVVDSRWTLSGSTTSSTKNVSTGDINISSRDVRGLLEAGSHQFETADMFGSSLKSNWKKTGT